MSGRRHKIFDMTGVQPNWGTPRIDNRSDANTRIIQTLVVPGNTTLQIVGRPDVQVNEQGLTLIQAIVRAMQNVHKGEIILPDLFFAKRVQFLKKFRDTIMVEIFETEEARLKNFPIR